MILAVVGPGCCPHQDTRPVEIAPREVVIGRINANTAGLDFLMKATGEAVVEVMENGQPAKYAASTILFHRQPRKLFMQMKHSLDPNRKIEIGSNDREFWLWDQTNPERFRYYWGLHENMNSDASDDLPIRPDHLPNLVGAFEIAPHATHPKDPIFLARPDFYELIYRDESASGEWYIYKIVRIDRRNPPFPSEIILYDTHGYPIVEATLSNYRPILDSERTVQLPHEIRAHWLNADTKLVLEFGSIEYFDNPATEPRMIDQSPLDKGEDVGMIERVDQEAISFPSHIELPSEGTPSAETVRPPSTASPATQSSATQSSTTESQPAEESE